MPENTSPKTTTTWIAGSGRMTFIMPDRTHLEVPATSIDNPNTLCTLVDAVFKLNEFEQDTLVKIVTGRRQR